MTKNIHTARKRIKKYNYGFFKFPILHNEFYAPDSKAIRMSYNFNKNFLSVILYIALEIVVPNKICIRKLHNNRETHTFGQQKMNAISLFPLRIPNHRRAIPMEEYKLFLIMTSVLVQTSFYHNSHSSCCYYIV